MYSPHTQNYQNSTPTPVPSQYLSPYEHSTILPRYSLYKQQHIPIEKIDASRIYTKQGLIKRSEYGWDGVKLAQYVTAQISENYTENQKILEKFRKEAEENRRNAKFKHAMGSPKTHENEHQRFQTENHYKNESVFLPSILNQHQPHHLEISHDQNISEFSKNQNEFEESSKFYRNVGINTNKEYEKKYIKKYIKLQNKYDVLKNKYHLQKKMKKEEAEFSLPKYSQKEEFSSIKNIKDIEHELMSLSMKLETNNHILNEEIIKMEKSRLDQHKERKANSIIYESILSRENNQESNVKERKNERSLTMSKKFRTEPVIYEEDEENFHPFSPKTLENPEIHTEKKNKKIPTVVYSKSLHKDSQFTIQNHY